MKSISSEDKNDIYFRTDHLKKDLKGRSVRGGAITIAAQGSKFVLRMGSTVFLARLLAPEDYGLIGMATVIIGFVNLFKDLGLSAATIQKSEINHKQVSTLFWINLAISCIVGLFVAVSAPAVTWFYNEPRLTEITLALASSFVFSGLTIQHQALLTRQMQFTTLAKIDVISMLIGLVTGVIAAWYGLSYWALVLMQIASAITNAVGVWIACGWRPGAPIKDSGVGSMLAFGGNLTGFRVFNYFSRNLDNVLIGRYWGSQELGLYAKAYQLVLLPIQQINNPVNSVALPALSSLQNEPEKYCRYYYKAVLLITTLGMPIVGFMFASADKVILLMLGQQWLGVVPLFQFLMPAAFMGTFSVASGWVYQSLGRTDRQFRVGIITATLNSIIFLISVRWGAIGVAAAYGLSRPIIWLPIITYCYRGTPLQIIQLLKTLYRPAFASIGSAILLIGINQLFLNGISVGIGLLVDIVLYGLLYIATWIILPNGKVTLLEILKMLREIKKKKS
ncbi:lipopolysaccharide biosynthesis protein [Mastigocoleus testarum]|uniref:Sugar transporter n=1 Tax=Mastigocoleus testarum BC008 TaxID=371196 RepID=A0A0V7ZI76_9CYAN|nr:lipopolysaccharide biosynthesis protein [Mastigocoleus testarum]KST64261.1 sugar transporter [Mastigocoleus testarum BC008]